MRASRERMTRQISPLHTKQNSWKSRPPLPSRSACLMMSSQSSMERSSPST